MVQADDYLICLDDRRELNPYYDDHMKHVMRSYAVWYYAYTISKLKIKFLPVIDYFIIVYKPFNFLYKLSGIIMSLTLAVGYAICLMNIAFIAESECSQTTYGKIGRANTTIFLVLASFAVVFAHT